MADANPTYVAQVGGAHYGDATDEQHWDICERYDIAGLEWNASKYMVRAGKKVSTTRREDLEKAISYLVKMGTRPARRLVPLDAWNHWSTTFLVRRGVSGWMILMIKNVLVKGSPPDIAWTIRELRDEVSSMPAEPSEPLTPAVPWWKFWTR